MNSQFIDINDYKFDSLRKYMLPVYWELRHNEHRLLDEKEKLTQKLISQFFKRLRKFRGVPIERISKSSGCTPEMILDFEYGNIRPTFSLEDAYCRECGGHRERDYFNRRIFEFVRPGVREEKNAVALNLAHKFGIIIPDVDFSRLKAPPGTVTSLLTKIKKPEDNVGEGERPQK